jgi:hypothetical protein
MTSCSFDLQKYIFFSIIVQKGEMRENPKEEKRDLRDDNVMDWDSAINYLVVLTQFYK